MKIDLSGVWQFKLDASKEGLERQFFLDSFDDEITLPTTVSEAKKSVKNNDKFDGYLTDHYSFCGYSWYSKNFVVDEAQNGMHFTLNLERTRKTRVWIDSKEVESANYKSFCACHRYELNDSLEAGEHTLVIMVDNDDYDIAGGHMTSADTQTNWNGIVGDISLNCSNGLYIGRTKAYPNAKDSSVDILFELFDLKGNRMEVRDLEGLTANVKLKSQKILVNKDYSFEMKTTNQFKDQSFDLTLAKDVILKHNNVDFLQKNKNTDADDEPVAFSETREGYIGITVPVETVLLWDEYNPNVYLAEVSLYNNREKIDEFSIEFGMRTFGHDGLKLLCNGNEIFLRGTHDGLIFPLTGYAPMDLKSWVRMFEIAKEYGFNHYRFHTCVPPMAAFKAANYLGIYLQPELPLWGSLFDWSDEKYNAVEERFITEEGLRVLDDFGNEPSFFGMSMGNELWGSKEVIDRLVWLYKDYDDRHMYTQGSNNHQFVPSIQEHDDFFSGVRFSRERLFRGSYAMCDAPLGIVQTTEPSACIDFDEMIEPSIDSFSDTDDGKDTITIQFGTGTKEVKKDGFSNVIPTVPVVSHEVGQYETSPDFNSISKFTGVLSAENLVIFKQRMELAGLAQYADDYFKASCRLAGECYKRECEAAMRSSKLSGYQLLDFKDFTGQGTALVGIMDAFYDPKGVALASEFRMFNSDAVLLPTLETFNVKSGSEIKSEIKLRYYRPDALKNIRLTVSFLSVKNPLKPVETQTYVMDKDALGRGLFTLGEIRIKVPAVQSNEMYSLMLRINGTDISNSYSMFVYADTDKKVKENVVITSDYEEMIGGLESGKNVLFYPGYINPKRKIDGVYCTDFWCYTMFRQISESVNKPVAPGTLGLLIDDKHPALKGFDCKNYSTPQWYYCVEGVDVAVLDGIKHKPIKPIVRVIDNIERNHDLGLIYELKACKGKLLVCMANLLDLGEKYPYLNHLHNSLVTYASSSDFNPDDETDELVLNMLFNNAK